MVRVWQWLWDRYAGRYSWAVFTVAVTQLMPVYLLLSLLVLAFEGSDRYLEAAAAAAGIVLVLNYVSTLPGLGAARVVDSWAGGRGGEPDSALKASYSWSRAVVYRSIAAHAVLVALLLFLVGAIAGVTGPRLGQYAMLGARSGLSVILIAAHSYTEAALRPVRLALARDSDAGDHLPRAHPTFAQWSHLAVLSAAFSFGIASAMLTVVVETVRETPVLAAVVAGGMVIAFGIPITVGTSFAPSLQPLRDLADGTKRVAAGDYSQRLPVVQDDDLGALAASFNRMQAGLAERQRLQAAFGTYVDPSLAARLLEQGDDVFTGERREVTVMFVDIRDFTAWAEANAAEDAVSRLNVLFEIVVPAVTEAGGHVNKFLGDGALAVFGAPNELVDHADAAARVAVRIQSLVSERFGGGLRVGIGINTGVVIAGTIGGGGKLEFTLIGDAVNVAARVEQLTKTTGDTILLTQQTVEALHEVPAVLVDRGAHAVKGKSAPVTVYGLAA